MNSEIKKIFNKLVDDYAGNNKVGSVDITYKEEGIYFCSVVLDTAELVFYGYAWIVKDKVIVREV